jgi:hypothetical protein
VGKGLPDERSTPDSKSGWFAFSPGCRQVDDDRVPAPPEGSTIRFMGEDSVVVPLWGQDGLLVAVPDELVQELRASTALTADIVAWAHQWQRHSGEPDHDAQAARLVRRLSEELDNRYEIVFEP